MAGDQLGDLADVHLDEATSDDEANHGREDTPWRVHDLAYTPAVAQVGATRPIGQYERLSAEVSSRPGGRLGVIFQIKGRHDPAIREEARISLVDLLRGQAFKKRIALPAGTPINLTLDTSLNFDELLQAFRDVWAAKKAKRPRSAVVQAQ